MNLHDRAKKSREACQVMQQPKAAYDEITRLKAKVRVERDRDAERAKNYEAEITRLKAENEALQGRAIPVDPRNGRPQVTNTMKAECIGEFEFTIQAECGECIDVGADEDCDICQGGIEYERKITVPWDTCKQIYKAMAEVSLRQQATDAEKAGGGT